MKSLLCLTIVAALLFAAQTAFAQKQDGIQWLSVPALNTGGDRAIGFDLKVSHGSIRSLPNVPMGWFLLIGNDASGMTDISGNVRVGAAAVDASYFRRFVWLRRQDSETPISRVTLDIVVTKDFETERHISVPASGLLLSKSSRQ